MMTDNLRALPGAQRLRASRRVGVLLLLAGGLIAAAPRSAAADPYTLSTLPTDRKALADLLAPDPSIVPYGAWVGATTSQADTVMNAAPARAAFGVDGSGVKIGIISDSFNFLNGQAGGVLSGDLPGPGNPNGFSTPVTIVNDDLVANRIDEGRAMAELIHDLAPGAELLFHSAFNNAGSSPGGSIATAIDNLVAAGADIIVDDVFNLTIPVYQDGASAQAANAAFAAGVPYFSAAGNGADNSYEARYTPSSDPTISRLHDFDANASEGGSQILRLAPVPDGGVVRATLWWEDPYATVGGTPTSDFDLLLVDLTNGGAVVAGGLQNQLAPGVDAFEFVADTNESGGPITYGLVIDLFDGAATNGADNKLIKLFVDGTTIDDDDDTNSPTVFGHSAAEGALAVAAAPYFQPNTAETFTSVGPTTILFDETGQPGFEVRATPELTAIDGTNTTFFGSDIELDGFPNFFGTSAAAPHVAAVAALVLERARALGQDLTPAEVYDLLLNSTIDIEAPGFDNVTGFGRLDAQLALSQLIPEPSGLALVLPTAFGAVLNRRGRLRPQAG